MAPGDNARGGLCLAILVAVMMVMMMMASAAASEKISFNCSGSIHECLMKEDSDSEFLMVSAASKSALEASLATSNNDKATYKSINPGQAVATCRGQGSSCSPQPNLGASNLNCPKADYNRECHKVS